MSTLRFRSVLCFRRGTAPKITQCGKSCLMSVAPHRVIPGCIFLRAVSAGRLSNAITSLSPVKPKGPWWVLCDNESFLRVKKTQQAYRDAGVPLWQVPPRSPDLNSAEKFWSLPRRKLRAMDLKDAVAKRPVLGKMAYKRRVRSVCSPRQAQRVAKACALGLKKVCKEVIRNEGAATSG